jgi:hypothetical protein
MFPVILINCIVGMDTILSKVHVNNLGNIYFSTSTPNLIRNDSNSKLDYASELSSKMNYIFYVIYICNN